MDRSSQKQTKPYCNNSVHRYWKKREVKREFTLLESPNLPKTAKID